MVITESFKTSESPIRVPAPSVEVKGWRYTPQVFTTLNALRRIGAPVFQDTAVLLNNEGILVKVVHAFGEEQHGKEVLAQEGIIAPLHEETKDGRLGLLPYYILPSVIGTEEDGGVLRSAMRFGGFAQVVGMSDRRVNEKLLPEGVLVLPSAESVSGGELYNPIAQTLNKLNPTRKSFPNPLRTY